MKSEEVWVSTAWWLWGLIMLVFTIIVLTVLNFAGVIGERIVFKNSFQYQESKNSSIVTWEASLAEITHQLRREDLDPEIRSNLEAKQMAIRIQLNATRRK